MVKHLPQNKQIKSTRRKHKKKEYVYDPGMGKILRHQKQDWPAR